MTSSRASMVPMSWELGVSIVGVIAVCYGFLISFGLRGVAPATKSRVVLVGAAIILILAVALILLPLLKVY